MASDVEPDDDNVGKKADDHDTKAAAGLSAHRESLNTLQHHTPQTAT